MSMDISQRQSRRIGSLPELLAPAGSFDALVAAVAAGADAVYPERNAVRCQAVCGKLHR